MAADVRERRREQILQSARRCLSTFGYSQTTISEICQGAGIARSTFYQYFDNKLDVFRTLLNALLWDLQECIRPISLERDAPPPIGQIRANLQRVVRLALAERELTQFLVRHAGTLDPAIAAPLNDFYRRVAAMIERSLRLGMAMGLVRRCDPHLTAYAIVGGVKEVVFQLTASPKAPPVDQLVEQLLEFGVGGVLAGSDPAQLDRPLPLAGSTASAVKRGPSKLSPPSAMLGHG